MSDINVLDASAVLALLQAEKGEQVVRAAILAGGAQISAVNYSEVVAKLCEKGVPDSDAQAAVDTLNLETVAFDGPMALRAGFLRVYSKSIGASLGDRACLALAHRVNESADTPIVYTAEKQWSKLKWPFKIIVIR